MADHSYPAQAVSTTRGKGALRPRARRPCLLAESPEATRCVKGSDDFVASIAAPTATGWNDSCRAGFAPAEDARLGTAHSILTLRVFEPRLSDDEVCHAPPVAGKPCSGRWPEKNIRIPGAIWTG